MWHRSGQAGNGQAANEICSGMESLWPSCSRGPERLEGLVERKNWVTEAARHVVLLVQQPAFGVKAK